MMNIETLIERYFDGQTSCEEERLLRQYFNSDNVAQHLKMYRPLFAYIQKEIDAHNGAETHREDETKTENSRVVAKQLSYRNRFLFALCGVAAGLLLIISIKSYEHSLPATTGNFVIIDGKKYTDENMVREQALAAFRSMQTTEEEVLELMFD